LQAHNAYNRNKKNILNRDKFYKIISQLYDKYGNDKKLYEELATIIHYAGHEQQLEIFGIKELISYLIYLYNSNLSEYTDYQEDKEEIKLRFDAFENCRYKISIFIGILQTLDLTEELTEEDASSLTSLVSLYETPIEFTP
jgi:hypothetical protein